MGPEDLGYLQRMEVRKVMEVPPTLRDAVPNMNMEVESDTADAFVRVYEAQQGRVFRNNGTGG